MKPWIIGCGGLMFVLVVLVVVFLIWWSRNPIVFLSNSEPVKLQGSRLAPTSEGAIDLELSLSGPGDGYFLSTIDIPREVAEAAGIQAPAGFREEPMPLEPSQQEDPDAAAFVKKWNAENVRLVGRLDLQPGSRYVLSIPAKNPRLATGILDLTYEWHGRYLGGSIRSTRVALTPTAGSPAAEPGIP